MRTGVAALLLGAALGVSVMGGCRREAPTQTNVTRPVRTTVLGAEENTRVATLPGRARATRVVELTFQVPGLLVDFPIKEGQTVAKGAVIAALRGDEFRARLGSLEGQLEQSRVALRIMKQGERPEERARLEGALRAAEARLVSAQAQYDRFATLVESRAVSRAEFDRVEAEFRVAKEDRKSAQQLLEIGTNARPEDIEAKEAQIRGLESRVAESKVQLADTSLVAPFDGVVAQRFVEVNQSVNVRQPIVRLQSVEELSVDVDVPESLMATNIREAKLGEATAEFTAVPGRLFPVTIEEVAQVADPVTQTFRVRFSLKAAPGVNLLPGMSAIVRLRHAPAGGSGQVLRVPSEAIYSEGSGTKVAWIIGADGTARRREVKVGSVTDGRVEVLEGLIAGDRIATAGVGLLRDGAKVRDLGDALGGAR
jgi:multidrug efflux system membrane fusion protein